MLDANLTQGSTGFGEAAKLIKVHAHLAPLQDFPGKLRCRMKAHAAVAKSLRQLHLI